MCVYVCVCVCLCVSVLPRVHTGYVCCVLASSASCVCVHTVLCFHVVCVVRRACVYVVSVWCVQGLNDKAPLPHLTCPERRPDY